ncbi:hypothetical protein CTRI78_v000372 [Colletotrichum trifolii]|uniref:Uncharacterized protein n=1 Tax=Colletotrichum trifolii TaxID=5466 RepID=A0A4R8RS52_COLTR|nr:hypothetical protein CTRI78_v000372 [Colletotrichum trifolii]
MADITHSPAVAGHRHGVWKGSRGLANAARTPRVRAEDSHWDPAWICEQSAKHFERLPARNLARQHSGWKVDDLEDEVDDSRFEVRTRGFLNNPDSNSDDVESSEGGESLNRKKYNYRMFLDVGSTDEQLGQTLGSALWVGTGIWKQNELVIDAYRIA